MDGPASGSPDDELQEPLRSTLRVYFALEEAHAEALVSALCSAGRMIFGCGAPTCDPRGIRTEKSKKIVPHATLAAPRRGDSSEPRPAPQAALEDDALARVRAEVTAELARAAPPRTNPPFLPAACARVSLFSPHEAHAPRRRFRPPPPSP